MPQWLHNRIELNRPGRLKRVQILTDNVICFYLTTFDMKDGIDVNIVFWSDNIPLNLFISERYARSKAIRLNSDSIITLCRESPCDGVTLHYQELNGPAKVKFLPALVNPLEVVE